MLRGCHLALGALILLAGCTTGPQAGVAPGDDCILGGPPRAPSTNRSTFSLSDEQLTKYDPLSDVFSTPSHSARLSCGEGRELMEKLSAEGADVRFGEERFDADVYLRHNGTTLRVALQVPA